MGERLIFKPFSTFYLLLLFGTVLLIISIILSTIRDVLIEGLGLPPEYVSFFLLLSLIGSYINIPFTTVESRVPIQIIREVRAFGVTWKIPIKSYNISKTYVMINLGGAIMPIITSIYLLINTIPYCSSDPLNSYYSTLLVLIIVSFFVNRSARIVKGLGIATPALGPPLITVFTVIFLDAFLSIHCPIPVTYIGGTLGTLIGADLLNLKKIPELGSPLISIGGAGTFDGVFLTGIISVMIVFFLLF
ncbi:DUF1614 domain-containing protein [Candidatus Bathyarchaeota archaeon]|nr:DUF1614 domain-containing protein [Candidatus Bathyarchaeota archaeon]